MAGGSPDYLEQTFAEVNVRVDVVWWESELCTWKIGEETSEAQKVMAGREIFSILLRSAGEVEILRNTSLLIYFTRAGCPNSQRKTMTRTQ